MLTLLAALIACAPPAAIEVARGTPLDQLPPAGVCNPGDIALANGVPTGDIQVALDLVAATSGTVTICAGHHVIYPLFLWSFNGNVMVTGETSDPADTVLDGDGFGTLLDVLGDGHWIRNLTFTNAGYSAVSVSSALDPQIVSNCIFVGNDSSANYVVHMVGANNQIYNSYFIDNSGRYGALDIAPNGYLGPSRIARLSNVTFIGNRSEALSIATIRHDTTTFGGLATIDASGLLFENNESQINTFLLTGGGVRDNTHVIEVSDLSLIRNTTASGAAGLALEAARYGTLDVSLTNARFIDNVGASSTTAAGAALDLRAPPPPPGSTDRFNVTLRDVRFGRNSNDGAYPDDAAVYVDPRYRVRWQGVDFASGAYANFPADLSGCAPRLGLNVRGTTDATAGDLCP
jgi:hypothetical protein